MGLRISNGRQYPRSVGCYEAIVTIYALGNYSRELSTDVSRRILWLTRNRMVESTCS